MKALLFFALALMTGGWSSFAAEPFFAGADLSSGPKYEKQVAFKMDGKAMDIFAILQSQGVNSARLRIWNDPKSGECGIDEVAALARRAQEHGMSVLLDFHYSDYWADPQKQKKPAAWKDLEFPALCAAVKQFTRESVARLVAQGTPPAMVQVGNEIRNGMLWPDGDVQKKDEAALKRLAELFKAGAEGVKEASPAGHPIPVVLHVDAGGFFALNEPVFEAFKRYGADYDIVGLSYYPGLSGTMNDLKKSMAEIVKRYGKEVMVAEISWPWKGPMPYGGKSDFPMTPEGQAGVLKAVVKEVQNVPGNKGIGIYYWGGEIISGSRANEALFDGGGNAFVSSIHALAPSP